MKIVVQSLWIGDRLSPLEVMCIKSFLDNGHDFHLYTYGDIKNIPLNTTIKDANEILPESEIFRYNNGSVSAFSNWFRYKLLYERGGWWVDTDIVCNKPFDDNAPQIFTSEFTGEGHKHATTGVIKTILGCSVMKYCWDYCQKRGKLNLPWGEIGPRLLNKAINELNKTELVADPIYYHPFHYEQTNKLIVPNGLSAPEESYSLHLWNEMWSRYGIDKNETYPVDSLYGKLQNKHNKKLNILYLINYNYYVRKMSRVRFHSIQALENESNLMWWGPNFEGYDNNKTVSENLELLENKPDIIITYKPLEMKGMKDVKIPICLRYNEMYDFEWTSREINESGATLIICHHENDMEPYINHYRDKVKFVHIPHCAEKTVFYKNNTEKDIDILLGGATKVHMKLGQHYPLRDRLENLIPQLSSKYKIYRHPHPGYDVNDAHTDRYAKEFAQIIRRSKIALTDSGAPNSRFAKYIEIPSCGTTLAGDIPGQDQEEFKKFVIELNMSMTDKEILDKLDYFIKNNEERNDLANKGYEWSKKYSQEYYAQKLVNYIDLYLNNNL
jgi:hypothetical protein